MVLFLDFDGVLHSSPVDSNYYFSNLSLLETWLREHNEVKVVISSSWRLVYPFDQIVDFFSEDIQPRIIGKTPEIECPPSSFWRQAEIEAWIELTNFSGRWLALDDAVSEFEPDHPNLILTNPKTGLTEKEIKLMSIADTLIKC